MFSAKSAEKSNVGCGRCTHRQPSPILGRDAKMAAATAAGGLLLGMLTSSPHSAAVLIKGNMDSKNGWMSTNHYTLFPSVIVLSPSTISVSAKQQNIRKIDLICTVQNGQDFAECSPVSPFLKLHPVPCHLFIFICHDNWPAITSHTWSVHEST